LYEAESSFKMGNYEKTLLALKRLGGKFKSKARKCTASLLKARCYDRLEKYKLSSTYYRDALSLSIDLCMPI
jgi:hypothetical protein